MDSRRCQSKRHVEHGVLDLIKDSDGLIGKRLLAAQMHKRYGVKAWDAINSLIESGEIVHEERMGYELGVYLIVD